MSDFNLVHLPLDEKRYGEAIINSASEIQARVIARRRIPENVSTENFLSPSFKGVDLASLSHLNKTCYRLLKSIQRGEKIIISCEYELDSASAAALLDYALVKTFGAIPYNVRIVFTASGKNPYDSDYIERLKRVSGESTLLLVLGADECAHNELAVVQSELRKYCSGFFDVIAVDAFTPSHKFQNTLFAHVNPRKKGESFSEKDLSLTILMQLILLNLHKLYIDKGVGEALGLGYMTPFGVCSIFGEHGDIRSPLNRAFVKQGMSKINSGELPHWQALKEELSATSPSLNSDSLVKGFVSRVISSAYMKNSGFPLIKFLQAENAKDALRYLRLMGSQDIKQQEREAFIVADVQAEVSDGNSKSIFVYLQSIKSAMLDVVSSKIFDKYGKPSLIVSPRDFEERVLEVSQLNQLRCDIFKNLKPSQYPLDDGSVLLVNKPQNEYSPTFDLLTPDKSSIQSLDMLEAVKLVRSSIFGIKRGVYTESTSEGEVRLDLSSHRRPILTIKKAASLLCSLSTPRSLLRYGVLEGVSELLGQEVMVGVGGVVSFLCTPNDLTQIRNVLHVATEMYEADLGRSLSPVTYSDGEFPVNRVLDANFIEELSQLEPYGARFPYPQYEFDVKLEGYKEAGGVVEMKMLFRNTPLTAFWDNSERSRFLGKLARGGSYRIVAKPSMVMSRGRRKVVLDVVDIISQLDS